MKINSKKIFSGFKASGNVKGKTYENIKSNKL